jgi:hypothetical protein
VDTYNKASGYWVRYDPKRKLVISKHQLVLEKKLGRRLRPNELVHHVDGNKYNDNMSNLKVVNKSEHNKLHKVWKGTHNPSVQMGHTQRVKLSKLGWKHRKS